MSKKTGLGVIFVGVAALILAVAIVIGGVTLTRQGQSTLPSDGYVLGISQEDETASVYLQSFGEGTMISKKFPSNYAYQDIEGDKAVVAEDSFVHYSDGSISALADGIVVDPATVNDSVVEYYNLKAQMVMTSANGSYTIDNNSQTITFKELLWMLNEDKFLAASSDMTLYLANGESHTVNGYLEITFLDKGIVQIADETDVWQSLASNTTVNFASGAILNLGDGVVYNQAGEACITLDTMRVDMNSAIQVNSDSDTSWVPPTFRVTAENGSDGIDGDSGTDGTSGEDGDKGEEGTRGEEGKTGETGATGGTPGTTSSGKEDTTKSATMGTIRVVNMEYTASAAAFYLNVSDDDGTLTSNSGEIEIRNAETNQLVWSYTKAYGVDSLDITTVNSATQFTVSSGLNPDTEYVLIVKNGYSMQTASGTTSGTKTFVSRHFFTSVDGVSMQNVKNIKEEKDEQGVTLSAGGIHVDLEKQSYCKANSAMVRLQIGDETFEREISLNGRDLSVEFLYEDIASADIHAYTNTPYTLTLFTSESAANSGAYATNPDTGEFQGDVQQSAYQISGVTLKQIPELGTFEVTNSNQGYYTLEQKVTSDKDAAITKYTFIIEKQSSDGVVSTEKIESTTGVASWYYKDAGTYKITSVVTYNDNEKSVEVTVGSRTVSLTVEGTPVLSFEPYTLGQQGNEWFAYNSSNQEVDSYYNYPNHANNGFKVKELFDSSRAWGDLVINTNGAVLKSDSSLTITVTGDQNTYKNSFTRAVSGLDNKNGEIRIPLQFAGLAENGIYTITVQGTVIKNVTVGGTQNTTEETITLGRCFFRTNGYKTPNGTNQSVAVFQIADANDGENVAIVKWPSATQYDEKYINMNKNSTYYEERSAASAIEFTVYTNLGIKIGTFVKSIYNGCGYNPGAYVTDSVGAGSDYRDYLVGPLVNGTWSESSSVTITKQDLVSAGVTNTSSGVVTIEATALYDYGWELSQDAGYIKQYDGGSSYYNSIPLKTVQIEKNGTYTDQYLNRLTVDLGKQPPVLPSADKADQQIKVTELQNGGSDAAQANANIKKYGQNTVVGFQLQSAYENANGDTSSITYYAMTRDTYMGWTGSDYPDPVKAYLDKINIEHMSESQARKETGILFAITLTGASKGSVPSVKVFVEDSTESDMAGQWNKCWKKDESGSWVCTPQAGNIVYVPKDWMPRGYEYVFAYTLESFYGVTGTEGAWTYPYDINGYNNSQLYGGIAQLPRSSGNDFDKQTPSVASYLQSTRDENGKTLSTWRYYVYDPDNALKHEGSNYKIFASNSTNYDSYAAKVVKGQDGAYQQLSAAVSGQKTLASAGGNPTASQLFGAANKDWPASDIYLFDVTVGDGSELSMVGADYSIWLEMQLFDGAYSEKSGRVSFKEWCGQTTAAYDYFFLKTGSQIVTLTHGDWISGAGQGSNIQYQLVPSGTTEVVNVNVTGDASTIGAIAALRYEIYKNENGAKGDLLQNGTVNFANSTASIEMTNVNPGQKVLISIYPVYDTGYALSDPTDSTAAGYFTNYQIHDPLRKSTDLLGVGSYYAAQTLGADGNPSYSSGLTTGANVAGTQKLQLNFSSTVAANSIFGVTKGSLASSEAGVKAHNLELQLYQGGARHTLNGLQLGYGTQGAYNARENSEAFVYKVLAETEAVNLTAYGSTSDAAGSYVEIAAIDNKSYFSLEASRRVPTVTKRLIEQRGPVSERLSFTISESTYNMLMDQDNYDGKMYLEVYESNDNTDLNEAEGKKYTDSNWFTNITAQGAGTDGGLRLLQSGKFTYDSDKKVIGYPVDAQTGDGLSVSVDATSKDHTYTMELKNLMPGRKYYVLLYCYDMKDNKLVQFIDGSTITSSANNDTYYDENNALIRNPALCVNMTQRDTVRMGMIGMQGATVLKATYEVPGYNNNNLEAEFTTGSIADINYELSIWNENGTKQVISTEQLMAVLDDTGYGKSKTKVKYWNYSSNSWEEKEDTTWYKLDADGKVTDTELGIGYNNDWKFQWKDDAVNSTMKDLLSGKGYTLVLTAKYKNPLLTVKAANDDENAKLGISNQIPIVKTDTDGKSDTVAQDTAAFNVPAKADPNMAQTKASVKTDTTTDGKKTMTVTLNMMVNDLSYRLGFNRGADGVLYGQYGARIYYTNQNGGDKTYLTMDEITLGGVSLIDGSTKISVNGTEYIYLSANKRQTINFKAKENVQYVVEVYGVNLNDQTNTTGENKLLLKSSDLATLHQNLNIANADTPRMDDSKVELDTTTSAFAVTLYNGANLDKINTARLTVTIYHEEADKTITEKTQSLSEVVSFSQLSDVGGRTRHQILISLQDVLDQLAEQGDAISISVYLYQDATLYIDNIATYNLDSYDKPQQ